MRVKTFRGPDSRSVLKQIRAELGPDAVILSTQNSTEQGRSVCEIMAALETPGGNGAGKEHGASFPGWNEMHQEWSIIKDHLFSVLKPHADYALLTPRQRQSLEYLEREGMAPEASMHLWCFLKNAPQASILEALRGIVPTKPWNATNWPHQVHAFAGPHGVGKTSSLLRLALGMRREHPGRRICVVNADQQHGKGRLLLQHYAELGELPFMELRTREDWQGLRELCGRFDVVFLDLPGLARTETLERWFEDKGVALPANTATHLVLSPHYSTDCLRQFTKRFGLSSLASTIWTKLDEADRYGAVINQGYSSGLPVSVLSYGASMHSSLAPADDQTLWKLVFTHRLPEDRGPREQGRMH